MKYTKEYIEVRILNLKKNPVENKNIINKWMRKLRKFEED